MRPQSKSPRALEAAAAAASASADTITATSLRTGSEMDIEGFVDAWEWGSFLDFSIEDDDPLILSCDLPLVELPSISTISVPDASSWQPQSSAEVVVSPISRPVVAETLVRVRKRDPRLVCGNFLAGKIPCSCPEVDDTDGEEEAAEGVAGPALGMRKRLRKDETLVAGRCQVPSCEADISKLKGYHRRHRICLSCANASSVLLDGVPKRYCQQCGKFHLLAEFDQGKRSCRRKLEHHNKMRRRPTATKSFVVRQNTTQGDMPTSEICEDLQAKEISMIDSEDGHGSPFCSLPDDRDNQNTSLKLSEETVRDERADNKKSTVFSDISDKSTYSSFCPTDRISFKLYDWNPAEFPRRLRHQIFQWLASMPVELEGYIRPGCTILTVFIAMPQFMWEQLSKEAALYIRDLVNAPESMLWRKGNILIYLGNKVVQVMKDGTLLTHINMEVQVPKLHFVYPIYYEAGKPMEIFACGSNIAQPRLRFLVSFAGKYLVQDSCVAISCHGTISNNSGCGTYTHNGHEMFRLLITKTEVEAFGPAFIEVENASGLSNFIPVVVGNACMFSELAIIQKQFGFIVDDDARITQLAASSEFSLICEAFHSKQNSMSEILLDIAWLLRKPVSERNPASTSNIARVSSLLEFLTKNNFFRVLEQILPYVDSMVRELRIDELSRGGLDNSLTHLLMTMKDAQEIIQQGGQCYDDSKMLEGVVDPVQEIGDPSLLCEKKLKKLSLCGKKDLFQLSCSKWTPEKPCEVFSSRPCRLPFLGMMHLATVVVLATVLCLGACVVLLHPDAAQKFVISARRCLFGVFIS